LSGGADLLVLLVLQQTWTAVDKEENDSYFARLGLILLSLSSFWTSAFHEIDPALVSSTRIWIFALRGLWQ
jgi:hypothetical protein